MKLNNIFKYLFRFALLQTILTSLTIFYFDNYLISNQEFKQIIYQNLVEDVQRFFPFVDYEFITVDTFLGILVFFFLIILYSTKFYTYVNELTFSTNKNNLDEFFSIYLLWTSSLFVFMTIFRFDAISRLYLILFTFIVPSVLIILRNSEVLSSILGRSPIRENYISFNLDEESVFNQLRIISMRSSVGNYNMDPNSKFKEIIRKINNQNKEGNINLIIINLKNENVINNELLDFLINLNKKVLLLSKNEIEFKRFFIKRTEYLSNTVINYFNNDIQYGSKYILKRGIDITLSFLGIFLTIPIYVFIAIYIFYIDGKPFLIKQERIGLHGKKFSMFKFRTMEKNAHSMRNELSDLNERDEILFKIDDDPRLLKGASFLRKFSLDEIPQFINVLKGDMSLVGPRPLFKEDTKRYDTNYMRRLNVLPGITGLLQISDRNAPDFETWYKYDIEYIENWSIGLDLKIILKTPYSLFRDKNIQGI